MTSFLALVGGYAVAGVLSGLYYLYLNPDETEPGVAFTVFAGFWPIALTIGGATMIYDRTIELGRRRRQRIKEAEAEQKRIEKVAEDVIARRI